MSDDLVSRLRDDRHCNDWYLRQSVATALEEARAEIERLRASVTRLTANPADHRYLEGRWRDADRELSTLRARVREVVGPFADEADAQDQRNPKAREDLTTVGQFTIGQVRAACQLMEEVK